MNFIEGKLPAPFSQSMRAWRCKKGFWSFLIVKDDKLEPGNYYCSYRDMRIPVESRITNQNASAKFFNDNEELLHSNAPDRFAYNKFTKAVEACKRKYKELITR